ncbi:MAG: hypothetical protein ACYC1U_06710 [Candidatus Aquicultorales bacterium]
MSGHKTKVKRILPRIDRRLAKASCAFIALYLACNWAIYALSEAGKLDFLIDATAGPSSAIMRYIGINLTLALDTIYLSNRILVINLECTAIYLGALHLSFVLAYPTDLRRKMIGLAIGLPAIFAANILRLVFLAIVSESFPGFFDPIHDFVWQIGFIMMITLSWLLFVASGVNREPKSAVPG